jgi:NAD(P)-dependent dehydrogenase (short-subunit alcohol dehydrogenase family)
MQDSAFLAKMFDLTGRTALVTGSSRGIGRSIAMTLGRAGARVVFHGSRPTEKLSATVAEARAFGLDCLEMTADLTDLGQVRRLAEDCARECPPDILVLNASAQKYMTLEDLADDEIDREFAANVEAGLILIRHLLPHLENQGWGRVITIGSVNQWRPTPRLLVYAATKSAQLTLVRSLAGSHAAHNVTFNNIAPGIIDTDRNAQALADKDTAEKLLSQIPAARFGQPDDIAGLALLLASEAGAYINGADIPVTGGL